MRVRIQMPRARRSLAAIGVIALLVAACGGADEPADETADATDETDATTDEAENGADAAGGPSFDLAGQTVRVGSSQPEALGMGIHYAVDELERWGAEVEHSTCPTSPGSRRSSLISSTSPHRAPTRSCSGLPKARR